MSEPKQVNDKMTKAIIIKEYNSLFAKYKNIKNDRMTTADKVKLEENDSIIGSAINAFVNSGNVEDIATQASQLVESLKLNYEKLENIGTAVKIKEAELKQLLGVEAKAFDVISMKEAYDKEEKILQEKHEAVKLENKKENEKILASYEEQEEAFKKRVARKKEELAYEFDKLQKRQEEKLVSLDNQYAEIEKVLAAKEAALAEREAQLETDFKAKVAKINASHEKDNRLLANSHLTEINHLKETHEIKLTALESQVKELSEELGSTQDKLDSAYEQINTVALETVSSSKKDDVIKSFMNNKSN